MLAHKFAVVLLVSGLSMGCGHSLDAPSPAGPGDGGVPVTFPAPAVVCVDQVTTEVTVVGDHFAPLVENALTDPRASMPRMTLLASDGTRVALNEPPHDPTNTRVRWISQREIRFDVDQTLELDPDTGGVGADSFAIYGVEVCNRDASPDGPCVELPDAFATVPEPTVTVATPDIICTAEAAVAITLTGTGFLDINDTLPSVNVPTIADPIVADSVGGCTDIGGPAAGVHTCTSLVFTIPMGALEPNAAGEDPATYDLTVTNPLPTGADDPCVTPTPVVLTVVPPPAITDIQPDLLCDAEADTSVVLTGTGFLTVDGVPATVNLDGPTDDRAYTTAVASNCSPVTGPTETVEICTTLTFTVPQDDVSQDLYDVTVTNPLPPNCESNAVKLQITDAPAISGLVPPTECAGLISAQITVNGTFLRVDGVDPTATFDGVAVIVSGVTGCSPLAGPPDIAEVVETCTSLMIAVPDLDAPDVTPPEPDVPQGSYDIVITNAVPPGCSSAPEAYVVADPPTVTSVVPTEVCEDVPNTFVVNGSNLTLATIVTLDNGTTSYTGTVTSVTPPPIGTSMNVDFGAIVDPGVYDLTVSNGTGCDFTLPLAVTVHPSPFVFFVDPPVVFNGINTQVTIYVTNINAGMNPDVAVGIRATGTTDPLTMLDGPAGTGTPPVFVPNNKVQAVMAMGLAPGGYDVVVTDFLGCVGALVNGVIVTDNLTLTVSSIDPPFGWTSSDTPVTIDGTGFTATPRAYLNPTTPGLASAVRAVAFVSGTQLTGIVDSGLAVGTYDLIIVNPGGEVGVLNNAFTVTTSPPPVVTNLTPGSIPKSDGEVVTIAGSNFCPPAGSVTVDMTCRASVGGGTMTFQPAVNACNASDITITVDASAQGLADGSVCVVRVTNNDEGSYGDFSAMSVTNPSGNPTTFTDQVALNVARRAPATTSGRATRAARYVYVIGGDDGSAANALDSIETGAVDAFGALPTGWQNRDPLPMGMERTLAGAVTLGRFIYLAGGNDGAGAVDTVLRAEILDPLRAPQINDLDFIPPPAGTGTLTQGTWNYKVSAIFPMGDPNNPGGESLPSDVQPVTVPDLAGLELVLFWTPVPGASGYRVYRSPMPNLATGTEELIADNVVATSYADNGSASLMPIVVPNRIGDLGVWSQVATMGTAREGAGVALAEDPATAGTFYLYAVGGQDGTPAALASYEYLDIVVDGGSGDQSVGTFTTGAVDMPTARWQLGLYSVDNSRASRVLGTTTFLYAIGGRDTGDAGGVVSEIRVAEVTAGGELGPCTGGGGCAATWDDPGPTTARAGFGAVANHNTLYAFCGPNGAPGTTADSGEMCGVGQTCAGGLPDPPDLVNFNSTGNIDLMSRFLPGTAVESATIFLVGGDGGAGATATTETMPW